MPFFDSSTFGLFSMGSYDSAKASKQAYAIQAGIEMPWDYRSRLQIAPKQYGWD